MSKRIRYMGATPFPGVRNLGLLAGDWLFGLRHSPREDETHLEATMGWLVRAQDQGPDDGVARMYRLRQGWGASYPETTGYIIPTFLDYARFTGRSEFADRALRMARWESQIQMADGAVQGGVVTDKPSPAIFNTGQVLFGWLSALEASGEEGFRDSARRSADYLVQQMDADGAWRRNLSAFTSTNLDTYAYNVRSAWALMLAAALGNPDYQRAAIANVDFVLSLAHDNGWLEKNCLGRPEQPLLHTIAYAYQGLLECAILADRSDVLDVTLRGNRGLLESFEHFGRLHGRYAPDWNPTVRWRCLTGEAQTSIVWQRLTTVTGDTRWRDAAVRVNEQIKRSQALDGHPGKAGGIKGAHPITAPYGKLEYLNWAAKFFADALMLEVGVDGASVSG